MNPWVSVRVGVRFLHLPPSQSVVCLPLLAGAKGTPRREIRATRFLALSSNGRTTGSQPVGRSSSLRRASISCRGSSSGRTPPFQGGSYGFESRSRFHRWGSLRVSGFPLQGDCLPSSILGYSTISESETVRAPCSPAKRSAPHGVSFDYCALLHLGAEQGVRPSLQSLVPGFDSQQPLHLSRTNLIPWSEIAPTAARRRSGGPFVVGTLRPTR